MIFIEKEFLNFFTTVTQHFNSNFNNQDLLKKINTYNGASSLMLLEKTSTRNLPTLRIPATNTSDFIDIYFYSIIVSEYSRMPIKFIFVETSHGPFISFYIEDSIKANQIGNTILRNPVYSHIETGVFQNNNSEVCLNFAITGYDWHFISAAIHKEIFNSVWYCNNFLLRILEH
jgi:hypothetical protein